MDIDVNFLPLVYVFIVSTLGATLQGSVGFGLGFVAVPLLAVVDPRYLPGPLIMAALVFTILLSWREHESIQLKGMAWILVGRLVGTMIGIRLLIMIPEDHLSLTFAVMVMLGVLLSFLGLRLDLKPKNLLGCGTLSGLMATTSAIGGPPLAMIYQNLKGPELRATLSGIFVVGAIISILALSTVGYFGLIEFKLALLLLPGIITGFFISKYTAKILDRGFIQPAILTFSMMSGIILLIKTLA